MFAKVDQYGNVSCSPPVLVTTACKINVANFPFDEKHCTMEFARFEYYLSIGIHVFVFIDWVQI